MTYGMVIGNSFSTLFCLFIISCTTRSFLLLPQAHSRMIATNHQQVLCETLSRQFPDCFRSLADLASETMLFLLV
jgi:hypothetical protein